MKRNIITISSILAVLIPVSCAKMEEGPVPAEAAAITTVSAEAEQQSPVVKTALSEDDKVIWTAGDALAMFNAENGAVKSEYTISSGENTVSATFSGPEMVAETLVAVYPSEYVAEDAAISVSGDGYSVPVSIPSTQKYVAGTFDTGANLSAAVSSNNDFSFRNVMGVLELDVYTTAAGAVYIDGIQIAAAENLWGDATLTIPAEGEPALEFGENAGKILTIEFDGKIALGKEDSPTRIYALVPTGALAKGFTVSFRQNYQSGTKFYYALARSTKDNTIARSVIRQMPAKALSFNIPETSLANTHILEPGQSVNIYPLQPATGKLLCHYQTLTRITRSTADVNPTASAYTGGYYKITAGDVEGYAGYAMRDYSGNTVWSWTMWITDMPQDITLASGDIIMDRNLGATASSMDNVTSTYSELVGLKYQWGRKDPTFNASSNLVESTSETGTVAYTTANPTKYIYPSEGITYEGDWHFTGDDTLWGEQKTAFDPCPAGYRIPCGGTGTGSIWTETNFHDGTYDSTSHAFTFAIDDETSVNFPVSAYNKYDMASASLKNYGGSQYWCYNTVNMTGGSHYARIASFSTSKATLSTNAPRSNAASIRCQKITE